MIGGCGFCTGVGHAALRGKSTRSPWYSAASLVQISFIASTRSRISLKRVLNSVPWSAISSAFQPPPTPNRNRPPETWSSEATSFAVWIVSRCTTRQTPVPSLIVWVTAAAALSVTNGSMTWEYCLGSSPPDGNGDLRDRGGGECPGAQTDSEPRAPTAR